MDVRTSIRIAILMIIVALAAFFYFWHLGRADIITDESSYATRAIGMVDFDFGIEQPTPWQWVEKIPWWMRLSFHDHPPLVFLLQHYSIRLFGENPVAIRIPSVLAGIASVFLVYLIGRHLYHRQYFNTVKYYSINSVGVASAAVFAFTVNHVWISRLGLQESILIALMLASAAAFLKGLERPQWFPLAGTLLGFAFLTKYPALILVPVFTTLFLFNYAGRKSEFIYDRNYIRQTKKKLLIALLLFLAVASPVIIYNLQLYRNFGHFDFQFSLLFGQEVQAWQSRPGQEVLGSYSDRIKNFIPWLIKSNSPYFLMLAAIGLAAISIQILLYYFHHRRNITTNTADSNSATITAPEHSLFSRPLVMSHWSLIIIFFWLLLFLFFIGPAPRFLTILTPWLAIAAGYSLVRFPYSQILKKLRISPTLILVGSVVTLTLIESAYSYNSVIALDPIGQKPWTYSHLRRQSHNWGFNQLESYLANELESKMPDPAITFEFGFAREILNQAAAKGHGQGLETIPLGIVYNDNINLSATLWTFLRRIVYNGWPVLSAEEFRKKGGDFLVESDVKKIIFINPTSTALQDRTRPNAPHGDIIEAGLMARGAVPIEIKNLRGETAFRIIHFEIEKAK